MASFGAFKTFFFFTTGRRNDEADFKYFNLILILSVNVQIIYIMHTFITCQIFSKDNLFAADLSTG